MIVLFFFKFQKFPDLYSLKKANMASMCQELAQEYAPLARALTMDRDSVISSFASSFMSQRSKVAGALNAAAQHVDEEKAKGK